VSKDIELILAIDGQNEDAAGRGRGLRRIDVGKKEDGN
jgi:hypothetical protein